MRCPVSPDHIKKIVNRDFCWTFSVLAEVKVLLGQADKLLQTVSIDVKDFWKIFVRFQLANVPCKSHCLGEVNCCLYHRENQHRAWLFRFLLPADRSQELPYLKIQLTDCYIDRGDTDQAGSNPFDFKVIEGNQLLQVFLPLFKLSYIRRRRE